MTVVLVNTFDIKYDNNNDDIIDLDSLLMKLVSKFGEYQRSLVQIINKKVGEQRKDRDELFKNISTATPEDLSILQQLSVEIKNVTDEINKPLLFFKSLVDDYFSETNKSLIIDNEDSPLLINIKGKSDALKVTQLSSGEKQLLIIFLTVVLQKDKPFILLMDEPETSLHVEWQSTFIDKINELNSNAQIIIATHNPLIALNREPSEIGTIVIDSEVVKSEGLGTKHLDVSATLLNYFHLSSLVGAEMKIKLNDLFILKTKDSLSSQEEARLDQLEIELGNTLATNFIYDRHYLQFLRFIKENHHLDFDKLAEISDEEMDALLGEFKGLFDD
jgi:ABC-type ATPase involved in cell division